MRWIAGFIGWLWHISRTSWVQIDENLRARSGASALYLFLFLIFFVIGALLMLSGFDLDDVDGWVDRQIWWMDWVASRAFNVLGGLIMLLCLFVLLGGLWQRLFGGDRPAKRQEDQRLGWGCILAAPVIGYFAWFLVIG